MKFIAMVEKGKLSFLTDFNKARFQQWLKENEGQKVQIKRVSSKVSDNRRGWYFGGIIPFVKELVPQWQTLTDDQMHEVLKTEFNGFVIETKKGKRKYPMPVANRDVDSEDFDNYILRIAEWVRNNYALELPSPDEYKRLIDSPQLTDQL